MVKNMVMMQLQHYEYVAWFVLSISSTKISCTYEVNKIRDAPDSNLYYPAGTG